MVGGGCRGWGGGQGHGKEAELCSVRRAPAHEYMRPACAKSLHPQSSRQPSNMVRVALLPRFPATILLPCCRPFVLLLLARAAPLGSAFPPCHHPSMSQSTLPCGCMSTALPPAPFFLACVAPLLVPLSCPPALTQPVHATMCRRRPHGFGDFDITTLMPR